jgi:hypothetical protein
VVFCARSEAQLLGQIFAYRSALAVDQPHEIAIAVQFIDPPLRIYLELYGDRFRAPTQGPSSCGMFQSRGSANEVPPLASALS